MSKTAARAKVSADPSALRTMTSQILQEQARLREGGGKAGQERQKKLGRLTARQRIAHLIDKDSSPLELGLWAAYQMYPEAGEVPAAGVIVCIAGVQGRPCMIIANDATVKAGAFFPATAKKIIRAQKIAAACNLPIVYLVDSSGVYLPMQDEVFPDEDDFGRIFRNNAVLSAMGVPQYAGIMGNCVAGGAYLPVLCDKILMTAGSQLYLAGPALVKAALGQEVNAEELGGATMHAEISGTVDFVEKDDTACLKRLRMLIDLLPPESQVQKDFKPARNIEDVYEIVDAEHRRPYDARDLLACVVDRDSLLEYKADYGKTLICAYASIGGMKVGIVANQRMACRTPGEGVQVGGVIYHDSADKAARFVMDCSQGRLPIVFFQDVQGFMVGRDSEQHGIIRSGAKLVNAVSNATTPKITVIVGGSFGAGNYALCGKAYDPRFIFAWPAARYAVMGGEQASETLLSLARRQAERSGNILSNQDVNELREKITRDYQKQTDIRYGAARGWVDAIIEPHRTREVLIQSLSLVSRLTPAGGFRGGIMQV